MQYIYSSHRADGEEIGSGQVTAPNLNELFRVLAAFDAYPGEVPNFLWVSMLTTDKPVCLGVFHVGGPKRAN